MLIVGIDPGLTGACSVIDHNGLRAVFDLPTMEIPGVGKDAKVKRKIDGYALCGLLLKLCPASEKPMAVIEAVSTMGGQNNAVQTQGSLLRSLGALETVIECLHWPLSYVQPRVWKKHFGLINPNLNDSQRKAQALECARRLYPQCNDLARAKDHNRAESLLLAHWMRKEVA